jgi:hypothetical protein
MAASGCGLPGFKRVNLTTRSAPEIVTHIYSVLTFRHAIFSTRSLLHMSAATKLGRTNCRS